MKSLLECIAEYLALKLDKVLATDVVIIKMPSEPTECICISELQNILEVPPQVDAQVHYIKVRVRAASFIKALNLAALAAGYMQTDDVNFPTVPLSQIDTTGIVNFTDACPAYSNLISTPKAANDDIDQSKERIVEFTCKLITSKNY